MPGEDELEDAPHYDKPRDLSEHISELGVRLKRIIIAIIAAAVILSVVPVDTQYYVPLISYFPNMIINYVLPHQVEWRGKIIEVRIAQYNPFAGINILFKTAILMGILGASPVIAREIYAFISPALYPHEKKTFLRLSMAATGLFVLGVIVAILFLLPFTYRILIVFSAAVAGENTLVAFSDVEELFSSIIMIAIATGIAFEAPLIVYLLVSLGVVGEEWFTGENKKYIFLAALVLGAAISPDPTGIGMVVIGFITFIAIIAAAKLGVRSNRRNRKS